MRKVTQTYYTPVVTQEKRSAVYTVCNTVPETQIRTVTNYQHVQMPGCFDACGHWVGGGCQAIPVTAQVPVTVYHSVPETRSYDYFVNVCNYRTETRETEVAVQGVKTELRKETVPVTTMKPVTERVPVRVAVPKSSVETYEVTINYTEWENRKEMVDVVEYRTVTERVNMPVTRWTTVSEVVTETVPVRVCVPMAPPVCLPGHP